MLVHINLIEITIARRTQIIIFFLYFLILPNWSITKFLNAIGAGLLIFTQPYFALVFSDLYH